METSGAGPAGATFELGLRVADRHRDGGPEPYEFELLERTWWLLPGVFAPDRTPSTALYSQWLPYPGGASFLEIGCGAGVTAVTAALSGCAHVTALDINPAAVRNTGHNALRHGVEHRIRVVQSDLFDALDPDERFDLIFWNSNAIPGPDDFVHQHDLQRAVIDPGYRTHRRYLRHSPQRLTATGRIFLGFNSLGDHAQLTALAHEAGLHITEHHNSPNPTDDGPITYRLLELSAAPLRQFTSH